MTLSGDGRINMRIITINREFGSGGREIGKRLADELGFAYYDKEVITAIAKKSNLDTDYIEKALESDSWQNYPMIFSHTFNYIPVMEIPGPTIIKWQTEAIREIAKRGDCVIVGRAADAILSEENPFRIFVYADNQSKIERCRKRAPEDEHLTDREIEKKIRKIDKSRATNQNLVSLYAWGNREGFDLMVNTSGINLKTLIKPLSEYALAWFSKER